MSEGWRDPPGRPRRSLQGWRAVLLALGLVAATIALRLAMGFEDGDTPIGVMFVLPVVIAARFGGLQGGLAAVAALAVGTKAFFFPPALSPRFASTTVFFHWAVLLLVGLIVTLLVEDVRRAHARAIEERNGFRERMLQLRRFFENLSEGAAFSELLRDARGELVDGRVLLLNRKAAEFMGRPAEELLGKRWSELFGDELPVHLARAREVLAAPDRRANFELELDMKGGGHASRHYAACAFALDDRQYVTTGMDVTEQRELEARLSQAQRLESIGRLAGGVAHDFNNIVTVVLSSAAALKEDGEAGRPIDPELVDEIQGAGERARDLTRQLLALARRQVVNPVALEVVGVVQRSEKLLRRVLSEDVALAVRTRGAEGACVRADPGQVEQVLFNLAANARDAMPGGGTLSLEVSVVEAGRHGEGADAPRGFVVLTVRDDGTGMTPEVQAHAFEPFYTTKEPGKGTGLGLATVHGIVAQAGGHLHLASAPGRGSEFRICLPRIEEPTAEARPPAEPAARGAGSILVVEDDAQVRAVAVRALERGGYRILQAGSGPEALALVGGRLDGIDLVFTDVVMPGMGGHELALELQRLRPGLPVLYTSGYSAEFLAERRAVPPGQPLLQKPFTPEALLARVRELLLAHAA